MDSIETILKRYSTRSFKPDPVPKETIVKILEAALHSPSSGNSQPWEIYVAGGAVADKIRKCYLDRFNREAPPLPEMSGVPTSQWPQAMRDRMNLITSERQKLLGINPQDKASLKIYREFNGGLFKAPVMVILCMDRALSVWTAFDFGILSQSIMVAATNYGVDSIVAGAFSNYPDILHKQLEIPDHLKIVIGIGLGYADPGHIINTYRAPRRSFSEAVTFKGM
jgi:nitroreductase